MIRTKKRTVIILAAFIFAAILLGAAFAIRAEAKSGDRMVVRGGYTYIYRNGKVRTGWITYKRHRYYAHKTRSRKYPRGAVVKDQCRVKNGKMYYFDSSGKKITRNTETDYSFYELNRRGTSIRYIYRTRGVRQGISRYNCRNHHLQYKTGGRWRNEGHGYWWPGIDWQE